MKKAEELETVLIQKKRTDISGQFWLDAHLPPELPFKTSAVDSEPRWDGGPMRTYELRALVSRSQAEAIITAERADKEIAERNRDAARENFLTMQKSAKKLLERAEKAEADNAALIKKNQELEAAWLKSEAFLSEAVK